VSPVGQQVAIASAPPKPIGSVAGAWKLFTIAGLVLLISYPTIGGLVVNWWTDPNFSHGFFVPLFSGFVVWRERSRLSMIAAHPSWFGLPIIVIALLTFVLGTLGAELFLARSSLVLLLGGLVVYFLGWKWFRALLFPWLFLFLMIPLPAIIFNQITLPLQLLVSSMASSVLEAMRIPVLREGNVLNLPRMPLAVAEACSGIRSLMALATMALIYGYLTDSKIWRRTALALMAIPLAVLANMLRIVVTGFLAQHWDPNKALGFFHEFSGLVIFFVSLVFLLGFDGLLRIVRSSAAKHRISYEV
jgi:exosortase